MSSSHIEMDKRAEVQCNDAACIANINVKWLGRWSAHLEGKCPEYEYCMPSPTKPSMKKSKGTVVTYDNCNAALKIHALIINLINYIAPEDVPPGPTRESRK